MPRLTFIVTILLAFGTALPSPSETRHYLYMSTPDGAQVEGRSGTGILIFDIDNGHKFVRRIHVPIFQEGLRGFTGSLINHAVYYSTTNHRLGAFDLETEKVLWENTFAPGCCDRSSITMDGKKIYAPTGFWYAEDDAGFVVINAKNGDFLKRIPVGPNAHNSIASLDGGHVFLGTRTTLTMFDIRNDSIVRQIPDVGEYGIFPYTVTRDLSLAFVCLGKHVGFDVVDLKQGKRLHRVFASDTKIPHRTHGAGLTPDQKELWISDQSGRKLFYFDATEMPPRELGHVDLSIGGHGWVTFSLDGKYAYSHAPDIFDARTKKRVGVFRDEDGRPFASSKFIEVHFRDGKVVTMGHEFGLGRH